MVHLVRRAVSVSIAAIAFMGLCVAQKSGGTSAMDANKTRAVELSRSVLQFNSSRGGDLYASSLLEQNKAVIEIGKDFTTVRSGLAFVKMSNRDGKLLSFHSLERVPVGISFTQSQCEQSARAFVKKLGLQADSLTLHSTEGDGTVHFSMQATYGKFVSTQMITVEVSQSTGAIRSANLSPWMDHTKLASSKLHPFEACVNSASEAYSRYKPFPQGRIVASQLMIGAPYWGKAVVDELTPAHRSLIEQQTAFPIVRVVVADLSDSGITQTIDVDARSGQALSIVQMSLLGKSGKVTRHAMPEATFKLMGSTVAGALHPTGDQGEPQTKGIPVTLRSGNSLVTLIRPSGSEKLWFFDGMGWQAYRADPKLAAALKGYKKPAKFGKAKA